MGPRRTWQLPRLPKGLRALALLPLVSLWLYGCPSDETEEDDAGGPAGYEDVIYEGGTTDEALVAFVAALDQGAPQPDTTQAPLLTSPTAGEIPSDPIPTFNFELGSSVSSRVAPAAARWAHALPRTSPEPVLLDLERRSPPWTAPLAELLGPIRAAHAHGDPFNGYGYFLTISSSSDPELCRVFTGATSYRPSSDVWNEIVAAGEVTVSLVGATFEDNRIPSGGGPFLGSTTLLTITP